MSDETQRSPDHIDALIDGLARRRTMGEPRSDLRARVRLRIEAARPGRPVLPRLLAPLAVALLLIGLVWMARPARQIQTTSGSIATVKPGPKPAAPSGDGRVAHGPSAPPPEGSARVRHVHAILVPEPAQVSADVAPLPAPLPIPVSSIDVTPLPAAPPLDFEQLEMTSIDVAPLGVGLPSKEKP
jgi:hypothetical protein